MELSEAVSLSVLIDFPRNKIKCFSRNTRDGIHQLDTFQGVYVFGVPIPYLPVKKIAEFAIFQVKSTYVLKL